MELTDVIKGGTAAAAVYGISKTPKLDDIKVTKDSDKTDKEMENLLGSKDRAKEFIAPFESTLTAEELGKLGLKKDAAGQIVAMDAVTAGKMRDINAEIDASYEQYRDSVNAISNSDADDVSNIQGSEKHNSIGGNSYTLSNGNLAVTSNDSISAKYFQDLADKALKDKGSIYRNTIGKITGTAGWQQMTKSDTGKALAMPMIGAMISGTFPIAAVAGMWSANKEKLEQATNLVNDISGGTFDSNKPYGFRSGQQVFNYMLGWQNLDGELKKRGTNLKDFVRWGHSQGFITNQVLSNVNKYNPEYFEKVNTINARAKMAKPEADIAIATGIGDSGFVGTGGEPVGFGQVLHGEAEVVTKPKVEKPSIGVSLHGGEPTVTKPEPIVTKSEPTITKPEPTVTSGGQPVSGPHEPSGSGAVSVSSSQPSSGAYTGPRKYGRNLGGIVSFQEGGPIGNPMGQQQEQQQPIQDAGNLELVQEQGKDQSGVADDVKRDLNEGDFVINAPAREMAGHSDIERMITKAITELQRKGVKLDFGQKAEDPDSIVQALVSNKELIIPKVIAQQIGYDRLEKINNRGKQRVDEIEKEKAKQEKGFVQQNPQGQSPQPVQMGGVVTLEENKNQPIAVPRESFATMSSVGKRLLSPLSPEQADKELTELSKPSQSFEGFLKPVKMNEGGKTDKEVFMDNLEIPLSVDANNWFSIHSNPGVDWEGRKKPEDKKHEIIEEFYDPKDSARAIYRNLWTRNLRNNRGSTFKVSDVFDKTDAFGAYAEDPKPYFDTMADFGYTKDSIIDLRDKESMKKFFGWIAAIEVGREYYSKHISPEEKKRVIEEGIDKGLESLMNDENYKYREQFINEMNKPLISVEFTGDKQQRYGGMLSVN